MVVTTITIIALGVGCAVALAEWLHARRVAGAAHLAFGPIARPRRWAFAAPMVRVVGMTLAVWGALVLLNHDPHTPGRTLRPRETRQLLVCLDVSPSMMVEDAGPIGATTTRAKWAGTVLRGVLDRVGDEVRFSLVGFYTSALPMLRNSNDKNVLANMLDGLPVYVAFQPGPTRVEAGVKEAIEMSKAWGRGSTTLVIISDGDASPPTASYNLPASIADVLVLGVGDVTKTTLVAGHPSRQDAASLRQVAAKLRGVYLDVNRRHVPSSLLRELSMVAPQTSSEIGLRAAGIACLLAGGSLLAGITPLLLIFGVPRTSPIRSLPDRNADVTSIAIPAGEAS